MPAYVIALFSLMAILLAGIPSCSSGDVQSEQLNNNGTGMDRDHTDVQPEDTLQVDSSAIRDSLKQ